MRLVLLAAIAALLAACTSGSGGAASSPPVPSASATTSSVAASTTAHSFAASSRVARSSAAPTSATHSSATRGPATAQTVVRPVTAAGAPAAGYTSSFENAAVMQCDRAMISPVSVDRSGVYACGSSADNAIACWPAASADRMLCDHDPFDHVLEQRKVSYVHTGYAPEPGPVPFGLVLDNGEQCRIRVGGTGSSPAQHPDWVAFYFCGGEFGTVVFASRSMSRTAGIDESRPLWSVSVGRGDGTGTLTQHVVRSAVFVG